MKYSALIISLITIACNGNHHSNTGTVKQFDWLIGSWERTNEEKGKATFEKWEASGDSTYKGVSYTLKGVDTVWKENVLLRHRDTSWYYDVFQKEAAPPTSFRLISIQQNGFTCVNALNEFPKKIFYKRTGNNILAIISDMTDELQIKFEFRKLE